MAEVTGLTNNELNVAICEALGWTRLPGEWRATLWQEYKARGGDTVHETPDYATSIEALQGVEATLRSAGWHLEVLWGPPMFRGQCVVTTSFYGDETRAELRFTRSGPTEARARAEAALQALTSITTLASRETGRPVNDANNLIAYVALASEVVPAGKGSLSHGGASIDDVMAAVPLALCVGGPKDGWVYDTRTMNVREEGSELDPEITTVTYRYIVEIARLNDGRYVRLYEPDEDITTEEITP